AAKRTSCVWIERQQQAMALADQQPLQIAGAQLPASERAVAGAVVEERVDRRLRPHVVQGLDDPLGASVRHEVLVREGDLHRPRRRSRRTRATKTGSTR